jgi:hypothetical protein
MLPQFVARGIRYHARKGGTMSRTLLALSFLCAVAHAANQCPTSANSSPCWLTLPTYTDVRGDYASGTASNPVQITPQVIATGLGIPAPTYRATTSHYQIYTNHTSPNGRLLVFAPGQPDPPDHYTAFAKRAAKNGYHVIVLDYWNADPQASSENCNTTYSTNPTADNTCMGTLYEGWYRNEKGIDPTAFPSAAGLNVEDQLQNRLRQALKYLDKQFPGQNWKQFAGANGFDKSPYLTWSNVTFAGHSSGSKLMTHAAQDWNVHALIVLSGPNAWYKSSATTTACPSSIAPPAASGTPATSMYVYYNTQDPKAPYAEACQTALALTPKVSITGNYAAQGAHIIYNDQLTQSSCDSNQLSTHSAHLSTAEDCAVVAPTNGATLKPSLAQTYAVWDYLLTR